MLERVRRWQRSHLKESRYLHVMGVVETAKALSTLYGVSEKKAEIAALFHDYAKNFDDSEMMEFIERYGLEDDEISVCGSVNLYHGIVSAAIAEYEYGIDDDEVLGAIRNHTFGRQGMSSLEKIIYLSDIIEPTRDFAGVGEIRRKAFADLDEAVLMAIDRTLLHLIEKGEPINVKTVRARNSLIEEIDYKE